MLADARRSRLPVSSLLRPGKSWKADQRQALSYHSHSETAPYVKTDSYRHSDHGCTAGKPHSSETFHGFMWGKHDFPQIAALLRRLAESKDLAGGKKVHAFVKRRGYDYSSYIGNCLVQMYGACGCSAEARATFDVIQTPNLHSFNILIQAYAVNGNFKDAIHVFRSMSKRNVVSWTTIINSAVQQGLYCEAMMLFRRMECEGLAPNVVTIINILDGCSDLKDSYEIHCSLVKRGFEADIRVTTTLIATYGRCGSFENARYTFRTMPNKNTVSWSAIMTALTENGRPEEAVEVFIQMNDNILSHDKVSYLCALHACANLGVLKTGWNVHGKMIKEGFEPDTVLENALVTFYGKSGDLDGAMIIFRRMVNRNAVSWSAIIAACAQNGDSKEALKLFYQMKLTGVQPLTTTNISVLDACSDLVALEKGREIHLTVTKNGCEADTVVGNSLVNLYSKCGSLAEASCALIRIKKQDVISWNSIIWAHVQRGHCIECLYNFHHMLNKGIKPNNMTLTLVREACDRIQESRHTEMDVPNSDAFEPLGRVVTPSVNVYGRWSDIGDTRIKERRAAEDYEVAKNARGACTKIVRKMEMIDQLHPLLLNLANETYNQLVSFMDKVFDNPITKTCADGESLMDFYTEVVDSLNHAGHLGEAEDVLKSTPNATVIIPWLSLLCSCRLHGDVHRGHRAAHECFELDPSNASPYFELKRLCAS